MDHPNADLIRTFYAALGRRDAAAMAACYADDAHFSDPAFGELDAAGVRAMWHMLCARASDLDIALDRVTADDVRGSARWIASYTFAKTGRLVRNVIEANFTFRDGRIIRHDDRFDLWRWAGMALGTKGRLFGWLPSVQQAIRQEAARGLTAWRQRQND